MARPYKAARRSIRLMSTRQRVGRYARSVPAVCAALLASRRWLSFLAKSCSRRQSDLKRQRGRARKLTVEARA
eukprot:318946-Rhodomonas_salina.1